MQLIGRETHQKRLKTLVNSKQSEFIAVYGRRRTGKTFLIKTFFNYKFNFYTSGLDDHRQELQLINFFASLRQNPYFDEQVMPTNWLEAFRQLIETLEKEPSPIKVIFIDELPWMDTKNSDLKAALDMFWNMWASARTDIKLIVCGSAASWMLKTFVHDSGGFYNRATETMKLDPFTLQETQFFLQAKGIAYDQMQTIILYMALGGIPYYLNKIEKGKSAIQNIDQILFGKSALIKNEYRLLFQSLFKNHKQYTDIINVLFQKKKGLTRNEIALALKASVGGNLSDQLFELEAADFIATYSLPKSNKKNIIYKIVDPYILFYKHFVEQHQKEDNFLLNQTNSPRWNTWCGLAFELICYNHTAQIKKGLGIEAVQSNTSVWSNANAQIDLIIDRNDNVINLVEIKFSESEYSVSKEYEKELRNKLAEFQSNFPNKKSVWFVLMTTHGLKSMTNASMFQKVLSIETLFV
jgi:uncharacterized protein